MARMTDITRETANKPISSRRALPEMHFFVHYIVMMTIITIATYRRQ